MTTDPIHLDQVAIDGHRLHRRSATVRLDEGAPSTAWTVDLACGRAPPTLTAGPELHHVEASTADGRRYSGHMRIAERLDDEYGTRLRLTGPAPQITTHRKTEGDDR